MSECLVEQALKAKTISELVSIVRKIFSITKVKNVVVNVIQDEDPPYIYKTIIETEFYFLINWKKFERADVKERKRQFIRELNKLFYAAHKSLNVAENIYKFLKEFGISFVVFMKIQDLAKEGKFGARLSGNLASMFAGLLGSMIFNIVYDKTIERLLDKTKAKIILYPKFYAKLGCPKSIMFVEDYNYVRESVELMEFRIINQIIGKLRDPEAFGCKTLRFIYRIFTATFGLSNPIAKKLYKFIAKCK